MPVIVLSARAGEEARVEGLQTGADDYLVKPFSARELLARVGAKSRAGAHGAPTSCARSATTPSVEEALLRPSLAVTAAPDLDTRLAAIGEQPRYVIGAHIALVGLTTWRGGRQSTPGEVAVGQIYRPRGRSPTFPLAPASTRWWSSRTGRGA